MQKSLEVDLALIPYDDARRRDVELRIGNTARPHDAPTRELLHTGPGSGKMLRLVRRYASHDLERFPRVQEFGSDGRLVKWSKEAAGTRYGTSGPTIGKAHLKGACSAAAVLCLRDHAAAQPYRARLEHKHGQGNAVTVLAQKLARAVYSVRNRQGAFETEMCFPREPRREGSGRA